MSVDEIIKAVRFCIDEESNNTSLLNDEKDDVYMDNIIKAKIPDALYWVGILSPSQSLVMPNGSDDMFIKDYNTKEKTAEGLQYDSNWDKKNGIGCITFPKENPIRLIRLRGDDWHKAIREPYEEDSDESLYMYNASAKGTVERPIAVIVRGNPTRLLVQPNSNSFDLTFARYVSMEGSSAEDDIQVPDSVRSSFTYYLSYLLLSAYDDSKATQMYNIAVQQLGIRTQNE